MAPRTRAGFDSETAVRLQQRPQVWPVAVGDAVQHRVIEAAIGQTPMVAQQPLALGTELLDGTLCTQVAGCGLQLHTHQLPFFEGMAQQQILDHSVQAAAVLLRRQPGVADFGSRQAGLKIEEARGADQDRKSTRLNSSHVKISYAVFCLKK